VAEGGVMTIEQEKVDLTTVALILSGRLDAANAPLLEEKIKQLGNDIRELVLDFSGLTYISSVGLRVLLHAKKVFKKDNRKLTIKNMNETVREVFEMTGFLKLIAQEE
jgi:anti-sigma B factor antagonist